MAMALTIPPDDFIGGVHIHGLKIEKHCNNECLLTGTRVHIELHVKKVCRWLCQNYKGEFFIHYESEPRIEYDVIVDRDVIFEQGSKLYNILSDALRSLEVGDDNHDWVIKTVIPYGQKIYDMMSMVECNIIPVDIELVDTQVYDKRDVLQRSVEDENCGMVPAKESAIKLLKRKRTDEEEEVCVS